MNGLIISFLTSTQSLILILVLQSKVTDQFIVRPSPSSSSSFSPSSSMRTRFRCALHRQTSTYNNSYFNSKSSTSSRIACLSSGIGLYYSKVVAYNLIKTKLNMMSSSASITTTPPSSVTTSISQSLAQKIISNNQQNPNPKKLSIAIAGGGSSSITTLTSTNNSSSVFVTSQVLYDRNSFANFISSSVKQQSKLSHANSSKKNKDDSHSLKKVYNERNGLFGYCTSYSSLLLAYSSLKSTIEYYKPLLNNHNDAYNVDYNDCLGIGCTSALVSQSKEERNSKIYISIVNGFGICKRYNIVLDNHSANKKNDNDNNDDNEFLRRRRNRVEEEDVTGALILWSINDFIISTTTSSSSSKDNETQTQSDNDESNTILKQILNRIGDSISISNIEMIQSDHGCTVSNAAKYVTTTPTDTTTQQRQQHNRRKNKLVLLSPNPKVNKVQPILQTVIPSHPIIFPGSFNPVHIGHIKLAKAAQTVMSRKLKEEYMEYSSRMKQQLDTLDNNHNSYNDVVENIWNTTEYLTFSDIWSSSKFDDDQRYQQQPQLCPILFEMSLTNADKPSMDLDEVSRRIQNFDNIIKYDNENNDQSNNVTNMMMPHEWGILLTSAPLFIDKVKLLKEYLAPSAALYNHQLYYDSNSEFDTLGKEEKVSRWKQRMRLMTFVIGTDTMVRIINPKYYGDNVDNMLRAVREMGTYAHFVVGGRLEQSKEDGIKKFVTGEEELTALPADVKEIFTIITEEDFRVDISSTELRAMGQK